MHAVSGLSFKLPIFVNIGGEQGAGMIFFIGCKDTDKLIGKSLCINRENHGKGGFYHTTFAVWINTKTFYYEKDVSCFRLVTRCLGDGLWHL